MTTNTTTMNHYQEIIKQATKCPDTDLPALENIMRDEIFHSTLDWQTKAQLVKAAKQAVKILEGIKAIEEDFELWLTSDNVIKVEGGYIEQTTQWRQVFTRPELYVFYLVNYN